MRMRAPEWPQPQVQARRLRLELLAQGEAPRLSLVLQGIRKDLKMARRGADYGALEAPPTASTSPCEAEVRARFYCRVLLDDGHSHAWSGLERQRAAVAENVILPKDDSFDRAVSGLRTTVRGLLTNAVADLQPLKAARTAAAGQMAYFRTINNLPEDCKCDTSLWPWAGTMAACIALDAVPSAPAFGEGDPMGILGGWTVAALMGAINVFSGAVIAFGRRTINRSTALASTTGILTVLAGVGMAAFMALMATHYRYALMTDPADALQHASTTIQISLLPPSIDIKSSGLLGVSAISTAIAYYKTITSWGAYPGYRDKKIALDDATEALRELWNNVRDELEELRSKLISAIDTQVENVRRKVVLAKSARIAAGLIMDRYNSWANAVSEAYEAEVVSFREANAVVRQTPAPYYYKERPRLEVRTIDLRAQLADTIKDIDAGFASLVQRAERAKQEVDKIIDEALRQLGVWGPDDPAPDKDGFAPTSRMLPGGAA